MKVIRAGNFIHLGGPNSGKPVAGHCYSNVGMRYESYQSRKLYLPRWSKLWKARGLPLITQLLVCSMKVFRAGNSIYLGGPNSGKPVAGHWLLNCWYALWKLLDPATLFT